MSNDVIKTEQIGDYRIKICRDGYLPCPCKDWDMTGVHLFNSGRRLSEASNYEELFATNSYSLADAVCELACKYVPQKKFIEYINTCLSALYASATTALTTHGILSSIADTETKAQNGAGCRSLRPTR